MSLHFTLGCCENMPSSLYRHTLAIWGGKEGRFSRSISVTANSAFSGPLALTGGRQCSPKQCVGPAGRGRTRAGFVPSKVRQRGAAPVLTYSLLVTKEYQKWDERRTKALGIAFDVLQKFCFYDNLM